MPSARRLVCSPCALRAVLACRTASQGAGMSRKTASATPVTPKPSLQTSALVTVTRWSTRCSANSSSAFWARCWWNSTVCRWPVGAMVRKMACDREPLPVPARQKQMPMIRIYLVAQPLDCFPTFPNARTLASPTSSLARKFTKTRICESLAADTPLRCLVTTNRGDPGGGVAKPIRSRGRRAEKFVNVGQESTSRSVVLSSSFHPLSVQKTFGQMVEAFFLGWPFLGWPTALTFAKIDPPLDFAAGCSFHQKCFNCSVQAS